MSKQCLRCKALVPATERTPCKRCRTAYQATPKGTKANCACCGVFGPVARDHIKPLALGGSIDGPFQFLCLRCNSSKGTGTHCGLSH